MVERTGNIDITRAAQSLERSQQNGPAAQIAAGFAERLMTNSSRPEDLKLVMAQMGRVQEGSKGHRALSEMRQRIEGILQQTPKNGAVQGGGRSFVDLSRDQRETSLQVLSRRIIPFLRDRLAAVERAPAETREQLLGIMKQELNAFILRQIPEIVEGLFMNFSGKNRFLLAPEHMHVARSLIDISQQSPQWKAWVAADLKRQERFTWLHENWRYAFGKHNAPNRIAQFEQHYAVYPDKAGIVSQWRQSLPQYMKQFPEFLTCISTSLHADYRQWNEAQAAMAGSILQQFPLRMLHSFKLLEIKGVAERSTAKREAALLFINKHFGEIPYDQRAAACIAAFEKRYNHDDEEKKKAALTWWKESLQEQLSQSPTLIASIAFNLCVHCPTWNEAQTDMARGMLELFSSDMLSAFNLLHEKWKVHRAAPPATPWGIDPSQDGKATLVDPQRVAPARDTHQEMPLALDEDALFADIGATLEEAVQETGGLANFGHQEDVPETLSNDEHNASQTLRNHLMNLGSDHRDRILESWVKTALKNHSDLVNLDPSQGFKFLGEGGTSIVINTFETFVGEPVAVRFDTFGLSDTTSAALTKRSYSIHRKLSQHPGVVQSYGDGFLPVEVPLDCGRIATAKLLFQKLELLDGAKELADVIEDLDKSGQVVSPETALLFIYRLSSALAYVHDNGVVHRDLKPENVMIIPPPSNWKAGDVEDLLRRGKVKLIDLGLARDNAGGAGALSFANGNGAMVGTPLYMDPDAHRDTFETRDPANDMNALGVILYELLTGQRRIHPMESSRSGQEDFKGFKRDIDPSRCSLFIGSVNAGDAPLVDEHDPLLKSFKDQGAVAEAIVCLTARLTDPDRSKRPNIHAVLSFSQSPLTHQLVSDGVKNVRGKAPSRRKRSDRNGTTSKDGIFVAVRNKLAAVRNKLTWWKK